MLFKAASLLGEMSGCFDDLRREVQFALARLYTIKHKECDARSSLLESLSTEDPPEINTAKYELVGDLETRLGNTAAAIDAYQKALSYQPGNPSVTERLVGLLWSSLANSASSRLATISANASTNTSPKILLHKRASASAYFQSSRLGSINSNSAKLSAGVGGGHATAAQTTPNRLDDLSHTALARAGGFRTPSPTSLGARLSVGNSGSARAGRDGNHESPLSRLLYGNNRRLTTPTRPRNPEEVQNSLNSDT